MRLLLALLALLALPLLASFAPISLFSEPLPPTRTMLSFTPVPLDESAPGRRAVGKLIYLGGWSIRSNDARFGGISAIHVEKSQVTALSDAGALIRFALPQGGGAAVAEVMPLAGGQGTPDNKSESDSEAMAIHGKSAWIAFERNNQIRRYARPSWKLAATASPAAIGKWPGNEGSEAMVRLTDGRFLVFSEGKRRPDGSSEAYWFSGDPAAEGTAAAPLGYVAPEGFKITDAAQLPDGRLLFLNRRASLADGFTAKLTVSDKAGAKPGAPLTGREIASLRPPLAVDNMEALAVTREGGRTIIWIASDDNFFPLQRTLLLKFALAD